MLRVATFAGPRPEPHGCRSRLCLKEEVLRTSAKPLVSGRQLGE